MFFRLKNPIYPKEIIFTGNNYYTFNETDYINIKDIDLDFFKNNNNFESNESSLNIKIKKGKRGD